MAAVLGDLLQLTDFQTYHGVECLNVYFYRVVSVTGFTFAGYSDMVDNYISGILSQVKNVQSAAVEHTQIEVRNLSNGIDFYTRALAPGAQIGAISGDGLPSTICYTFRLQRETLVTRNGYKRYVGVPESAGGGNAYAPGAGQITNICAELAEDWIAGVVLMAEPVIVKRPIATPAGAYLYSSIGAADFRGIGSQDTRRD